MSGGGRLSGSVTVLSEHDQDEWTSRYRGGLASAERPYGMERLVRRGLELHAGDHPRGPRARKFADVLDHRMGGPVTHTLLSSPRAFRADVVLAVLDQYGRTAATMRRHHLPPWTSRPLVALTCWLGERLRIARPDERRDLVHAFGGTDLLTVWSRNQVEILTASGFSPDRVAAIPFGVNVDYFTPGDAPRTGHVLAVGVDAGRDYQTLFTAVQGTGIHVDLVCRPENLRDLDVPANVTVHAPVPHHTYRELLRSAAIVVVPCHELAYPTGQSVVLEASATGACVITTDTTPMREYVTDASTALTVPPADPGALREVLLATLDDDDGRIHIGDAARKRVRSEFSSDRMWDHVADLLVGRGWIRET